MRFANTRFKRSLRIVAVGICVLMSSCAQKSIKPPLAHENWIADVVAYGNSLPVYHSDSTETLLAITEDMREKVISQFSMLRRDRAAEGLAMWLIDEAGHNMRYDVSASLTPIQAFEQKRGNCLSFTILLVTLAKELNLKIAFNAVDIPNTWGLDPELGMVFYRHVNGVMSWTGKRQIFDLAMDIYNTGYPQRFISQDQALALLQNNLAIDSLAIEDYRQAEHRLKLALTLSPENADLWANLGVVMKRAGQSNKAEIAFSYALQLDQYNIAAVSNLERFYTERGQTAKAKTFKKQAARARNTNPYFHYQSALEKYSDDRYRSALRLTKKAIVLHNKDPRFFELKSRIEQQQKKYKSAFKSLKKAYALAVGTEQRDKYAGKAALVSRQVSEQYQKRLESRNRSMLLDPLRTDW